MLLMKSNSRGAPFLIGGVTEHEELCTACGGMTPVGEVLIFMHDIVEKIGSTDDAVRSLVGVRGM